MRNIFLKNMNLR